LRGRGKQLFYTPCDVGPAMVLTALKAVSNLMAEEKCFPFVCDLAAAHDLKDALERAHLAAVPSSSERIVAFFGMLPNFEPDIILPVLAGLLGSNDWLIMSANLAPGREYA